MGIGEKMDYQSLQAAIESSKSGENTENSVSGLYKEGYELLKSAEDYPKLHNKFKKEYEDLRTSILSSLSNDRKITQEELIKIKLELGDMQRLAEANGIRPKKNIWSTFGDVLHGTKSSKESSKAIVDIEKIKEKEIKDYSLDEKKAILEYLNSNYSTYEGTDDDFLSKGMGFFKEKLGTITTLKSIESKRDVNIFQLELIKKIHGDGFINNGFSNENILGFNGSDKNAKGNYVISISLFESVLKSNKISDINSLALANYIKYLHSKGEATPERFIEKFGTGNLEALAQIWETQSDTIVKKELKNLGLGDIINTITLFSSPANFLEKVGQLGEKEKSIALMYLRKNKEKLEQKFKKHIEDSINKDFPSKNQKEKEEILKNILQEFTSVRSTSDLTEIAKKITEVKSKYNLKSFSERHTTEQIVKSGINKKHIEVLEQEQEIKKLEKELTSNPNNQLIKTKLNEIRIAQKETKRSLVKHTQADIIVQKLDDTTIKQIGTGERKIEDIVQELREKDKSFDKELKKYEELEKKYPVQKETTEGNTPEKGIISFDNKTTLEYTRSTSGFDIKTGWGDIQITPEEFKIIESNKEAAKNLIEFKKSLTMLGLSGLWQYRDQIFKAISNTPTSGLKMDNDYINKNELKIFLASILTSIGITVNDSNNLGSVKLQILKENKNNLVKDNFGKSNVERKFIDTFDTKRNGIIEQGKFEQAIKTKA